jgi:hypothetical protein
MAEMLAALSADEEVTLTLAMHVALPRHPATHRRRSKVPHADKRRHPDQPVADISQELPIGDRRSDLGDVGSEAAIRYGPSRAIGRSFSFVVSEAIPC